MEKRSSNAASIVRGLERERLHHHLLGLDPEHVVVFVQGKQAVPQWPEVRFSDHRRLRAVLERRSRVRHSLRRVGGVKLNVSCIA